MKSYNEITIGGKLYWWRVYGHRGGRTYEIGEPAKPGKGRAIITKNVGFWNVPRVALLQELAAIMEQKPAE